MKKALSLLSAAGCLLLPAITHADPAPMSGTKPSNNLFAVVNAKAAASPKRVVYYITTETHTGSLIPMVYRSYGGRVDSASNAAVYGSSAIRSTGSLDVGSALTMLDPSITGRHR